MNLQQDFELRRCGEKIVLRQIEQPLYEFKTVFVADALVETEYTSPSLFILKSNGEYLICQHKHGRLHYVRVWQKYEITRNGILYCQNKDTWYLWQKDLSSLYLGKKIGNNYDLFAEKTSEGYVLHYIEDREVQEKHCKNYELLDGYQLDKNLLDFLRLETEEGVEFVSLYSEPYRSLTVRQSCKTKETHRFVFSSESSEQIIAFCKFVQEFAERKLQEGFGCVAFWEKGLSQAVLSHQHETFKLVLLVKLSSFFSTNDVKIVVNLWALFNGQTAGAYVVECNDLCYRKDAAAVRFASSATERVLFVEYDGKEDKLSCERKQFSKPRLQPAE